MPNSRQLLIFARKTHLYFGIFIAPALLFFAFTGALQTFSLHETTPGSSYKPPAWIAELAQLHKKQTLAAPAKKARPDAGKPCASAPAQGTPLAAAASAPNAGAVPPAQKKHLPMKIFFMIVSIGLFTSTITGLYMAYRYERNRWLVNGLLLAGIVIPLLLIGF